MSDIPTRRGVDRSQQQGKHGSWPTEPDQEEHDCCFHLPGMGIKTTEYTQGTLREGEGTGRGGGGVRGRKLKKGWRWREAAEDR